LDDIHSHVSELSDDQDQWVELCIQEAAFWAWCVCPWQYRCTTWPPAGVGLLASSTPWTMESWAMKCQFKKSGQLIMVVEPPSPCRMAF
jgi:hypothetical protein